jgi:hypothetical protein
MKLCLNVKNKINIKQLKKLHFFFAKLFEELGYQHSPQITSLSNTDSFGAHVRMRNPLTYIEHIATALLLVASWDLAPQDRPMRNGHTLMVDGP